MKTLVRVLWAGAIVAGWCAPGRAQPVPAAAEELLSPYDTSHMETVVVTARRSEERLGDAPVAVEVIDREQIETSGARDAAQVLGMQAGVQIDSSFRGAALLLSGLDPQHALILVDGERLVGARDGAIDLSRFFASDIERIEIVRGPASALYGSDAMAGVINIITRPAPEGLSGEALGRYGLTLGADEPLADLGHHGDAWASSGAGKGPVRGRASFGYRRQPSYDLFPDTVATTGSELESYSAQGRLDWLPSDRLRVPLNVRIQRRDQAAIDESGSRAVFDRTARSDELAVVVAPHLRLRDLDGLTTSLSYATIRSQLARDQRGDDDGDDYEDAREQLASARVQYDGSLHERVLLTAGLEALGQDFRSPRLEKRGTRGRLSPYVQTDLTLSERVRTVVVPSARVDLDSQYGFNVSPRLALRVDPTEGLALRAAVGRGFRAPSFNELLLDFQNPSASYRVSGNEELDPETSIGATLSGELSRYEWFTASVNGFFNDIDDLIDTQLIGIDGGERVFSYVNVKRARTQGMEAVWQLRPLGWLTLDLTYALTHTRDLDEKRPLPGRALHRGSGRLLFGGGQQPCAVSLRALLVGERRYYTEDEAGVSTTLRASPYAALDMRASYRFGDHIEPFVSAENLTNHSDDNTPLRPTTLFVGLSLRGERAWE
jgi:outer membrane receptor for ferrienterochelin and colicins